MKKQSLHFFLFLLTSFLGIAQSKIYLLDKASKETISNVYIRSLDGSFSYYTDINGTVIIKDTNTKYALFCQGYQFVNELKLNNLDTIYLNQLSLNLDEISITGSKRVEEIEIGFQNDNSFFPSLHKLRKEFILATYLNDSCNNCFIKEMVYSIKFNCDRMQLGFYLFEVDSVYGSPAQVVFHKDTVIMKFKNTVKIDISKLMLKYPQKGVFVGIELINSFPNDCEVSLRMNNKQDESYSYLKYRDFWKNDVLTTDEVWNLNQGLILIRQ